MCLFYPTELNQDVTEYASLTVVPSTQKECVLIVHLNKEIEEYEHGTAALKCPHMDTLESRPNGRIVHP